VPAVTAGPKVAADLTRQAPRAGFKPKDGGLSGGIQGDETPIPKPRPEAHQGPEPRLGTHARSGFGLDKLTKTLKIAWYQPAELTAHDRLNDPERTARASGHRLRQLGAGT
jgi:hypothetical protein